MRKVVILMILFSFIFATESFFRNIKTADFYEILSIYEGYLENDQINKSYANGLSLMAMGIANGYPATTFSGGTYIATALLTRLKVINSSHANRFERYKTSFKTIKNRDEADALSRIAIKELIEDEKTTNQINAGIFFVNGFFMAMNASQMPFIVGSSMMLFGTYIVFFEKGPLERMVTDYSLLEEKTVDVEGLFPRQ